MISAFRRSLDTWPVRAFFLVMVAAFIVWGIGDVFHMAGTATWVAKVGGQTIEGATFQSEYQRDLNQATRKLPSGQDPSAALRRSVGDIALQRLIGQAALQQELNRLHVVTPDAAVRDAVYSQPAFRGTGGKFSRRLFEVWLNNNGLTEQRVVEMVRGELGQRQLLLAVAAGAAAPRAEAVPLYQGQFEKRSADIVEFPFAAETAPAPIEAELQRWYDNHPFLYSRPELRRIRAIVLSPQTLAKDIPITAADLRAAYAQRKAEYVTPARRSAQVVSVPHHAQARALAAQWRGGADWAAIRAAAKQNGASAVALDDATRQEFPDSDLARAVFAAVPDAVSGPLKGALGWYVLKVVNATPGSEKTFDQVKDALRNRLLAEKATDVMYDRANKIDNLLGNGTPLDQMPGDLGLAGVAGTLDAKGDTKDGTPAPIPAPPELKAALVAAAFKARKGDQPQLTEVQTPSTGGSAYYAVSVEAIIPPAPKPFGEVKQQVAEDWTAHQRRHAAEAEAAKLLTALKAGRPLADAAAVAGVPVRRTPLVTSAAAAEDMPSELAKVLFGLKPGEPTMVATATTFVVAVPAQIDTPNPSADPGGYEQLRAVVSRSIGNDLASIFAEAVRERANPRINQENYNSIVQP
ncbi:MAG TPA: peptidyl-prolyl cis-trans isomerase [Acetobacteraceae bacterium]|nr:peptidyl-prolyl cis-trans isomerase [Acetobacteraceae bacterium]